MKFNERTQQIESDFSRFDDWTEKYNYLIELGQSLPIIDEKYKQPQYLIEGCQSRVWLYAELQEGQVFYTADSDAIITKGIISLLINVFSGHTPNEILEANLYFIDQIGLREHLSPTRANGLLSMIKQIKMVAMAYGSR